MSHHRHLSLPDPFYAVKYWSDRAREQIDRLEAGLEGAAHVVGLDPAELFEVFVRGDLVVVEPIGYGTDELAATRAFQLAAARRARLTSVGSTPEWDELVAKEAHGWDGLAVEYLSLGGVLTRFRDHPGTVDLVVAGSHLAGAIVDAAAHLAGSLHTVARAWLSANGPGVFAAEVCDPDEIAGFGVADPAGTLLAASLLLGEGLGARSAARTLERAVAAAEEATVFDTRSFTDAVITNLPAARTDTEHFQEVPQ